MMGAVVLSGLVFSSTEARADETITDIMDMVAGMDRYVSELRASAPEQIWKILIREHKLWTPLRQCINWR